MKLRRLSKADWMLIASNLVPVYGVWFLGWSAVEAFIIYALETLIIGTVTVLKMVVVTFYKGSDTWYNGAQKQVVGGLFFIIFFVVHFGMFAAIQTSMFSNVAGIVPAGKGLLYFFFHFWVYINREIGYVLMAFIVSYLAKDFLPFIIQGTYKTEPMIRIMFSPYGRIFIQQVTVILGSFFLLFGAGKVFILVFAMIKIWFEIVVNYQALLNKGVEEMQKEATESV